MKGLKELLKRGRPVPETQVTAETRDPLMQEQDITAALLTRIKEIAPKEYRTYGNNRKYFTQTLKSAMENASNGERGCLFLRSVGSLLEETTGRLHVGLEEDCQDGSTRIEIGWPSDNRLVMGVNWEKAAKITFTTRSFSYVPSLDYLKSHRWDESITPELAGQIYSNAVLETMLTDLEDNRTNWETQLQERREAYFKRLEETRGTDGLWAVKRTLKRLADAVGDEPYMIFAPDPGKEKKRKVTPIILYTTASLTQEVSERFSRESGGYYYPTQFQASNARDAKPVIITPYHRDDTLIVEVRQTDSLQRNQARDLQCSFSNFMYGKEESTIFRIFPPDEHQYHGIDVTLVAVNPASLKLEREGQKSKS